MQYWCYLLHMFDKQTHSVTSVVPVHHIVYDGAAVGVL